MVVCGCQNSTMYLTFSSSLLPELLKDSLPNNNCDEKLGNSVVRERQQKGKTTSCGDNDTVNRRDYLAFIALTEK